MPSSASTSEHVRTNIAGLKLNIAYTEISRHAGAARCHGTSTNLALSDRLGGHFYFSCFFKVSFKNPHAYCICTGVSVKCQGGRLMGQTPRCL